MSKITCFHCYNEIDFRATTCPHCLQPTGPMGREMLNHRSDNYTPNYSNSDEPSFFGTLVQTCVLAFIIYVFWDWIVTAPETIKSWVYALLNWLF